MNICVFFACFALCFAVTSAGVIAHGEDQDTKNFQELALINNELAFQMHRRLLSEFSDNVFFSPFGISTVFGTLLLGARGHTAKELKEVMGYTRDDFKNGHFHNTFREYFRKLIKNEHYSSFYLLNVVNGVVVDKQFGLLDEYRREIDRYYRGAAKGLDFKYEASRVVREINNYVRDKTYGKIRKIFDKLNRSVDFLLLNVVYFKGTWKTKFEQEETRYETFYNNGLESEGRSVPLMHVASAFPYASFDNFQAVELPYHGEDVSMIVLLPHQRDGLQALEESLTHEKLADVLRYLNGTNVHVSLPKFSLHFEKELLPEIRNLSVHQIFRYGADFSGMIQKRKVAPNQIFHKAVIEVNEEGRETASITVKSATDEIPQFIANHPFFFAIVEKGSHSNMILYMGNVNRLE